LAHNSPLLTARLGPLTLRCLRSGEEELEVSRSKKEKELLMPSSDQTSTNFNLVVKGALNDVNIAFIYLFIFFF
jgi:hypothetical protein